jgi:hypothetical protein
LAEPQFALVQFSGGGPYTAGSQTLGCKRNAMSGNSNAATSAMFNTCFQSNAGKGQVGSWFMGWILRG